MDLRGRRESNNVEDRRRQAVSGGFRRGIGIPLRGKSSILVIAVVIIAGIYGVDLTPLLTGGDSLMPGSATRSQSAHSSYRSNPQEDEMKRFTAQVLASTEDSWQQIFRQMGKSYRDPKLVVYRGATQTGCGTGQSVMGPFYCPADQTVYIDLSFYQDMVTKLRAGGDFAQAYVVAHEVGHHVQNLLGINEKVRQLQRNASNVEQNRLSVKLELQADCFAGVWGHSLKGQNILENGDLEKALNAARAIGDDRLQQQSSGRVIPDSFTHGTSEQRYTWFKRGFDSGKISSCNTFE